MVRALVAGTKTQTRRALKAEPPPGAERVIRPFSDERLQWAATDPHDMEQGQLVLGDAPRCTYGAPGDRLWVREAWHVAAVHDHVPGSELGFGRLPQVQYEAIGDGRDETRVQWGRYRHARFMPRWASRITLEVTEVRVERLQDISEADALAEGVTDQQSIVLRADGSEIRGPVAEYAVLWEQINGPGSWEANPWVWVVAFRRVTP